MAQRPSQPVIDTHLHVLQPSRWHYHWLAPDSPFCREFLLAEYEDERVYSGVLVEAANSLDEIHWLLEMSEISPMRPGVIGWVDLAHPSAPEQLQTFAQNALFKGVRLNWLASHPSPDAIAPALEIIAELGLTVDVLTSPDYLPSLRTFIAAYPEIPFVLNHMGGVESKPEAWRAYLQPLAALPNVIGKITGMFMSSLIDMAAALFGSDRLMFGSNVPFSLEKVSYSDLVTRFCDAISALSEQAQADIGHRTAQRVYRLP